MTRALCVLAVATVTLAVAVPPPAEGGAMDEAGLRSVWAALDQAWNGRDAERFSGVFTTDASFEIGGRDALTGREAIQRAFSQRFPQQPPELRHRTTVREVQALAADMASVDGGVEILREVAGAAAPTVVRRFALVAVMAKTGENWRIRLLRAFPVPDPASAPDKTRP